MAETQKIRVLIVEDELEIRRVFELGLAQDGCAVSAAASGREALSKLMRDSFDVLVVDLRMEEMNGMVFLQEALKIWPWLGVVVCSAFVNDDMLPKVAELGVTRILEKPVPLALLSQNVRDAAQESTPQRTRIPMDTALTLMRDHLGLLARVTPKTVTNETFQEALFEFAQALRPVLPSTAIGILVSGQEDHKRELLLGCHAPVNPRFLEQMQNEMVQRYRALSGTDIGRDDLHVQISGKECAAAGPEEVASTLSVPVIVGDQVAGLLTLAAAVKQSYSSADVALLYHAANHVSVVFTALERIQHMATRDPLTEVFNRTRLEDELQRTWLMSRRYGFSMAAVIIDIDDFKTLNDSFGHATGDEVIRDFARLLVSVARASDIVARYGGDEFVVVLPRAAEADACALAERFLAGLRAHVFCRKSHQLKVTASIGIAASGNPTAPATGDELLQQADRALYRAKRTGRDRVCIWPEETLMVAEDASSAAAGVRVVRAGKTRDHVAAVDDEPGIRDLIRRMLESDGYAVSTFASADEALQAIRGQPGAFDVLLTDLALPGKSGLELLREVGAADDSIVKLVMTGYATVDGAVNCLREGAYDFVQKPVRHAYLSNLIRRALEYRHLRLENARYQRHLEEMIRRQSAQVTASIEEVKKSYEFTLEALVRMLDAREQQTGQHSVRTRELAVFLAQKMGVSGDDLEVIGTGAFLHDIGKIGIPDEVLLKKGTLTRTEWDTMKQHSDIGYRILCSSPHLEGAAEIVRSHHERYDGKGYPRGLQGSNICLGARIFAVIDAYDSMRSQRVYRAPLEVEEAVREIQGERGRQFDPDVVDAFLKYQAQIERLLTAPRLELPAGVR